MHSRKRSGPRMRRRPRRTRGTSFARVKELEVRRPKGPVQQQQQQQQGVRTDGGKREALQYLFGAAQEWRQQTEAAKGHLSAVGSTVRLLPSQQVGGGPTLDNVLPDYWKTMTTHDNVASRYPTETMVKAACTPDFTIPKPPAGSGTGSSRPRIPRSAFLTFLRSVWNSVAKIGNFVQYHVLPL